MIPIQNNVHKAWNEIRKILKEEGVKLAADARIYQQKQDIKLLLLKKDPGSDRILQQILVKGL